MQAALHELAMLAGQPDAAIDLTRTALTISRLLSPELDQDAWISYLERLAVDAARRVPKHATLADQISAFNDYLYDDLGFRGNSEDYYDPRNSLLDQVLARRLGIPITLAVVYTEVGRRIGLPLRGIGFPGHFLVKAGQGPRALILDAFDRGEALSEETLDARLNALYGDDALSVRANPRLLRASTNREILVRLLRNLKSIYLRRGEYGEALTYISAILVLVPDLADELRDRGLLYRELGYTPAALDDLHRFTALSDDAEEIAAVAELISEMEDEPICLH